MIQIIVNTEGNEVKLTCKMAAKGRDAIDEFKMLNCKFNEIRGDLLKKFPLYVQAEILTDMLKELNEGNNEE